MTDKRTVNIHGKECIIFAGAKDSMGYGLKRSKGRLYKAHRLAYLTQVGGIPKGLELDHLCSNRACIEVSHLEPVTHAENVRRGQASVRYKPIECPKGHIYTQDTSYFKATGHRVCKPCSNEYSKKYYAEGRRTK